MVNWGKDRCLERHKISLHFLKRIVTIAVNFIHIGSTLFFIIFLYLIYIFFAFMNGFVHYITYFFNVEDIY